MVHILTLPVEQASLWRDTCETLGLNVRMASNNCTVFVREPLAEIEVAWQLFREEFKRLIGI